MGKRTLGRWISRAAGALVLALLAAMPLMLGGCSAEQKAMAGTISAEETAILPASNLIIFHRDSFSTPSAFAANTLPATAAAEEIWIIETAGASGDPVPCLGTLVVPGNAGAFAMSGAEVRPTITSTVATIAVIQQFVNRASSRVNAQYCLALPANATPCDFLMTVGTRQIRAIVRDRASAERIMKAAQDQGLPVSFAKAGGPVTFSIDNIDPGNDVAVTIQYVQPLVVRDGVCSLMLESAPAKTGRPDGALAGRAVTIDLNLDAGMTIEKYSANVRGNRLLSSTQYHEKISMGIGGGYRMEWTVAGKDPKAAMLVQRDRRGSFYGLSVVAPADRAVGGLVLMSKELGEIKLPEIPQGQSLLVVARVAAEHDFQEMPVLTFGNSHVSLALREVSCPALPALWARAQHDNLAGDSKAEARKKVALDHGLLTEETAVLAVDTTAR